MKANKLLFALLPMMACNIVASKTRPNILFILSDDHTSQAWGIYPGVLSKYIKNDNIKRLAKEGCVLDNCFCTNSISVPSRATILTGAYSHKINVRTLSDALQPSEDNIAKEAQKGGYQTALIGKWHLKKEPSGFDYFSVFPDQGEYRDPIFLTADNWKDDQEIEYGSSVGQKAVDNSIYGKREKGFSTDLVTQKTINWLNHRDKSKPFMMCCHFKATHEPWDYPKRMEHLYDGIIFPEPENMLQFDWKSTDRTFHGQQLENLGWRWTEASHGPWWCNYPGLPFSTENMDSISARKKIYQKLVKDFLRCGATIDDNIGKLLKYLDDNGLAENTIVVYVADQGYFLGEHAFFDKRMMYEESLRMPFVIRYPKEIPAGTRNNDIMLNIDFAPTIADYAGIKAPAKSQGRSFRSNLAGKTPTDWRKCMYYRYWTHHDIRPAHMGIRTDRYKLIYFYADPLDTKGSDAKATEPTWEFFDLRNDPFEDHNSYNDPIYQNIISKMKKELKKQCELVGDKYYTKR